MHLGDLRGARAELHAAQTVADEQRSRKLQNACKALGDEIAAAKDGRGVTSALAAA